MRRNAVRGLIVDDYKGMSLGRAGGLRDGRNITVASGGDRRRNRVSILGLFVTRCCECTREKRCLNVI